MALRIRLARNAIPTGATPTGFCGTELARGACVEADAWLLSDRDHQPVCDHIECGRGPIWSLGVELHRRVEGDPGLDRRAPMCELEAEDRRAGRQPGERRPDDLEHVAVRVRGDHDTLLERQTGEEQRP